MKLPRIPTIIILLVLAVGGLTVSFQFFAGGGSRKAAERTSPSMMHLQTYCSDCHGVEKQKGDFDLAILLTKPNEITLPAWEDVLGLIQSGEMPPEDEPQPTASHREELITWLAGEIKGLKAQVSMNQEVKQMRRLTPAQYWNSLEALMGAKHTIKTPIPDYDVGKARENYQLTMTPEHLDSFMRIAEEALVQRLQPFRRPTPGHLSYRPHSKKYGLLSQKTFLNSFRSIDESVGILNNGNTKWGVHTLPFYISTWPIEVPGRYRIRVTAKAVSEKSQAPVVMGIAARYSKKMLHAKGVQGSRTIKEVALTPGQPYVVVECEVDAVAGETVEVQKRSGKHDGGQTKKRPTRTINEHLLLIRKIEIVGPLVDTWPTPQMAHLFGDFSDNPSAQDALGMLRHFAENAYRRPLSESQAAQIERFFNQRLQAKPRSLSTTIWKPPTRGDHRYKNRFRGAVTKNRAFPPDTDWRIESAVLETCVSILMNRQFLFQFEPDEKPDDYAVASRLSYFLWNSPPDNRLLADAKNGQLGTPASRLKAAAYCLDHPNAERFCRAFVDDWLSTDEVGVMEPDQRLYGKQYDGQLRRAMRTQSLEVFREVLRKGEPAAAMLKADWTMLNGRLAKHYGIPGVAGAAFQRVPLKAENNIRGSILGHAGIMQVLANGTQTLPITRGVWVLENLLGTPPPPPPPNIPLIEPDTRGAVTLREQLDKHRDLASCKRCHEKIDPFGIALENFDAIGGWRDNYPNTDTKGKKIRRGVVIDSSGNLPDGSRIEGPKGLADYLLAHRADFNRCLTKKLFEYALGRPLSVGEMEAVEDVLQEAKKQNDSLRAIILSVASHPLYLN
ncbi:MAG: hypothetical protein ACI9OD_004915 [Limisphaerales bacterium]|jgi:hypothetical protein